MSMLIHVGAVYDKCEIKHNFTGLISLHFQLQNLRRMARSAILNFNSIFTYLYSNMPVFSLKGDQISVLRKPEEFYDTLTKYCSQANKRISFASLYIGTGEKEKQLVDIIKTRSLNCGSSLKIKILLDGIRSSRGTVNSKTILSPVLENNSNCQVALFFTPALKGIWKLMPSRYNELVGLQHIKVYVIDDNLIISGANLSHDYFTNRQDRYILIKNCKHLADFYDGLLTVISSMSHLMNNNNKLVVQDEAYNIVDKKNFSSRLRYKIKDYMTAYTEQTAVKNLQETDTWIFPTVEIPPADLHYDTKITMALFSSLPKNYQVSIASGYFNLTNSLAKKIILSNPNYSILMAHPKANGFYNSNGFSKYVPAVYSVFSQLFYERVKGYDESHRIHLFEYIRDGWTYHGKGIWITAEDETLPQFTSVGSSNFGDRSKDRDLESQLLIFTDNNELKKQLKAEHENLFKYGEEFSAQTLQKPDRRLPFWVPYFALFAKSFF